MDTFLLLVFLVLVVLMALVFYTYVLSFMVTHHIHIKQYASKLLLVHGILEVLFLLFSIVGFAANLHPLILFFFAIDFLLVAWIVFDVLYGSFFYDGAKYKGILTGQFVFFLIIWCLGHYIIGYYDLFKNEALRYVIPGLIFLGVALVNQTLFHDYVQFKNLREYVALEIDHVEQSDKWKVLLVSKQYKFLHTQFLACASGLVAYAAGLVDIVIEGLSLLGTILFCIGMILFMIQKGCQLLGFFYPVPQWKEALEGR